MEGSKILKVKETLAFQFPGINLVRDEFELKISKKTKRVRSILRNGNTLFSLRTSDGLYIPTMHGAEFLIDKGFTRNNVYIVDDAVPFVSAGRSAFCKHIYQVHESIRPGSVVLVLSQEEKLLAVGIAQQPGYAMMALNSGAAVNVKHNYPVIPSDSS